MALGLLAGLLQGSGTALLVDRREGLIWNGTGQLKTGALQPIRQLRNCSRF